MKSTYALEVSVAAECMVEVILVSLIAQTRDEEGFERVAADVWVLVGLV